MTLSPAPADRSSGSSSGWIAANLICLASMLTWAAGLPAAELVIDIIPPLALTALRCSLAAAVLMVAWIAVEGFAPARRAAWGRALFVGGVCIGVGAVFLVIAQARTDPVTVAIITAIMPVIGIALEVALDGRRLTAALVLGLVLSLAGGFFAYGQATGSFVLGFGAFAALASVVAFTWGSRATVTAFPDLTPLGRTAITVTGAALTTGLAAALWSLTGGQPVPWDRLGLPEWAALALFGIGSLALSQILWIIAVGRIGIGISSLHMNAVPFYVMLILFALGAPWSWPQAIGAAIVVVGVLIAQGIIPLRFTRNA
jgi:drug/metabolite transporter (DMT)-like permease